MGAWGDESIMADTRTLSIGSAFGRIYITNNQPSISIQGQFRPFLDFESSTLFLPTV